MFDWRCHDNRGLVRKQTYSILLFHSVCLEFARGKPYTDCLTSKKQWSRSGCIRVLLEYCATRATVNTRQNVWHFFDIFFTSWDVWCLVSGQSQRRKTCNKAEQNDKLIPAPPKRAFSVNSMAAYHVKVKYGEERFCTYLIKEAKLMQEIERYCLLKLWIQALSVADWNSRPAV